MHNRPAYCTQCIEVTALGWKVMHEGEKIFDELRDQWEQQLGAEQLAELEAQLTAFVGDSPVRVEAPGWIAQDMG